MSNSARQKKTVYLSAVAGRDYEKLAPQAAAIMETVKSEGRIERRALLAKLKAGLKSYKQTPARLLSYYKAALVHDRYLKIEVEGADAPAAKTKPAKVKPVKPAKSVKVAKPAKVEAKPRPPAPAQSAAVPSTPGEAAAPSVTPSPAVPAVPVG